MKQLSARSRIPLGFLIGLLVLYGCWVGYYRGLTYGPVYDEVNFWETTQRFLRDPLADALRNYGSLNTPLPFLIFAANESLFHGGLPGGRWLNLLLSFAVVAAIGWRSDRRAILAAVGLMSFPYFWQLSLLMYTDLMAGAWALAGVWAYLRGWNSTAGLAFVLAIASRQFTIAFPAAIVAHELTLAIFTGQKRPWLTWAAPLAALTTLAGWFWLFGGLAPKLAMREHQVNIPASQHSLLNLDLSASLYALACIGVYFVLPEFILLRPRWRSARHWLTWVVLILVLVWFVAFPIANPHGVLRKILRAVPHPVALGVLVLAAMAAAWRFARANLAFWLVLANVAVLAKAYPWEKYLLPLMMVLWGLKSWAPQTIDGETLEAQPVNDALAETLIGGPAPVKRLEV